MNKIDENEKNNEENERKEKKERKQEWMLRKKISSDLYKRISNRF